MITRPTRKWVAVIVALFIANGIGFYVHLQLQQRSHNLDVQIEQLRNRLEELKKMEGK